MPIPQTATSKPRKLTLSELNEYFAAAKIQCLECGKFYKALGNHLLYAHAMSVDTYRTRWGIPWRKGLVSNQLHDILHNKAKARDRNSSPEVLTLLEQVRKKALTKRRRPSQPATREKRRQAWAKAGESGRCSLDRPVLVLCIKCQRELTIKAIQVKSSGNYCPICLQERLRERWRTRKVNPIVRKRRYEKIKAQLKDGYMSRSGKEIYDWCITQNCEIAKKEILAAFPNKSKRTIKRCLYELKRGGWLLSSRIGYYRTNPNKSVA